MSGWKFSQQLKLYNQTHTKTNPLPLLQKWSRVVWGAAIFKAAPVSRSAKTRLHKPKKKRKEKTSMWDERNYWATFQNPATTTKTYRWKNITISVHLQKLCSAFCHWTLYIRLKSLCFHSAWGVKDASGWIFKQVLHQWFQWQLSFAWLQQLVSAMLKMLDVCLKLNYVFTPAFLSIRVNHLTAFFLLY